MTYSNNGNSISLIILVIGLYLILLVLPVACCYVRNCRIVLNKF